MQKDQISTTPFPYQTAEYEQIPCNLCGRDRSAILNRADRNGLKVASCICKHCGLIYLNPRLTHEWYGHYYANEYRKQMARFRGQPATLPDYQAMFQDSTGHGIGLAKRFQTEWKKGLTVEVGSSVGGVLNGIRHELGVEVLGIEPSPEESKHANQAGIKTFTSLIENFDNNIPAAANILCTQSLNHFLDPRYFLTWAHRRLSADGLLILEVMNFRHVFQRFGWMRRAIQIDHTYMFVPESLANFVEAAGFEMIRMESDELKSRDEARKQKQDHLPGMHIRIAARKTDRPPFLNPERIKEEYSIIQKSLDEVPRKPLRYFFKYRFKKWLKRSFVNIRT